MKKFKIAIDVSPLSDGNSTRGVGYYTRNLVSALQKEIKINPDYKNYQIELVTDNSKLVTGFNLVHYPYFDPFKLTLPSNQISEIVTCHDLIPLAYKKHFPVGLKGKIKWLIQKHRLQKANYIICPSFSAKYQILDQITYPSDQIFVTYEAATPDFKKITDDKFLKNIKAKYQLPDDFILFVGDINWNKNIPTLVKACLRLNYPIVIVGLAATKKVPDHPWTKDILWLQSQNSPLIHCLGFVPDQDLPSIYNLAKIYCQPSYSEGFGLPLLQAMQSGTPVCYSEDSCLPEIMDFNGEYFDPYSQISLENSLIKLWEDEKLRQKYSKDGQIRAKSFSWKYTALQTLALYQLIELNEKK
jgi:glycosyltransferase involved in cell wall biosynthesis